MTPAANFNRTVWLVFAVVLGAATGFCAFALLNSL
jgi:hypothetical protein